MIMLVLLVFSNHLLYSAQHSNDRLRVRCTTDTNSITYTRGTISDIAFIASKIDHTYKATLKARGDTLLDLSSSEDALKQFWILQAEHAAAQALLEKSRSLKTCIKKEERTESMRITKYIQNKDGVTLSAQCVRMCDGRKIKKFFGSSVSGTDDKRSAKELFSDLEKIYLAENPR